MASRLVGTCLCRVGPVGISSGRNQVHVAAAFLSLYIFVYALDIWHYRILPVWELVIMLSLLLRLGRQLCLNLSLYCRLRWAGTSAQLAEAIGG